MRPLPRPEVSKTKRKFDVLEDKRIDMATDYFKEMAYMINGHITYELLDGLDSSLDDLALVMNYRTYTKLAHCARSYLVKDAHDLDQLFGVKIQIGPNKKDGHVCLQKRIFEYVPSMEDWWEN